ncbi:hypothetical protein ACI3KS_00365 [Microbacterium sp. ZW T5_45]|uniref:hypothetical protein n=1 Tax=Microbacterium sp. ZW T5_45 TaxID=3378080 RepID=UPI0038528C95
MTIDHRKAQRQQGFTFEPHWFEFLASVIPAEANRVYSPEEQAFLAGLVNRGAIRIFSTNATSDDLNFELVPRAAFSLRRETHDGYEFKTDRGLFTTSEIGLRLLGRVGTRETVGEMAGAVMSAALRDPQDRSAIAESEASTGRSFVSLMFDECLRLIGTLREFGVATAEPLE